MLVRLAERNPLLVLLDDLHWADAASLGLLSHLARRLDQSRLLLVGAYRPEEVSLGHGDERHPLEKVVAELKRSYGDVSVDLGSAAARERRPFVDAIIDSEPTGSTRGSASRCSSARAAMPCSPSSYCARCRSAGTSRSTTRDAGSRVHRSIARSSITLLQFYTPPPTPPHTKS